MPGSIPHFNIVIDPHHYENDVRKLIQEICPLWKIFHLKAFTEGISNQLIGCFSSNSKEDILLVRIYGAGTEAFIDRTCEKNTMELLHSKNLGPPLHATFDNGLIYEYIPGIVLSTDTVKSAKIWPLVAQKVALIHKLPFDANQPLVVWDKLEKFLSLLPNDLSNYSEMFPNKDSLEKEYLWLKERLFNNTSKVVFCHNDLLLANIISSNDESTINFIDYEYAGPNYAAYEIANHFNEFAGVEDVNYDRLPTEEFQRNWIAEYLKSFSNSNISQVEVEAILSQVQDFFPLNHFFWGSWSLVQAINSSINFDFSKYASIRFNQMKLVKRAIMSS